MSHLFSTFTSVSAGPILTNAGGAETAGNAPETTTSSTFVQTNTPESEKTSLTISRFEQIIFLGFLMVFYRFSMVFYRFSMVFKWFSVDFQNGFSIDFLWFSNGFLWIF